MEEYRQLTEKIYDDYDQLSADVPGWIQTAAAELLNEESIYKDQLAKLAEGTE